MLYAHFTTKERATEIYNGNIIPPFHLTTDLARGSAYGSYMVLYEVKEEFLCKVSRVGLSGKLNRQANGMIEYVLTSHRDVVSFTHKIEACGVRHCIHIEHLRK